MAAGRGIRSSGDGGGGRSNVSSPTITSSLASPLWPVVMIEDHISNAITCAVTSAIKHLAFTLTTVSSHQSNHKHNHSSSSFTIPSITSLPVHSSDDKPKKLDKKSDLKEYSLQEVAEHSSPSDCWIVLFDKIYDVTNFLPDHPGGEFIILESAGRDATLAFRGTRHGNDTYDSLSKYLVGILPESERIYSGQDC